MVAVLLLIGILLLPTTGKMIDFGFFDRKLTAFYSWYGAFVARHPVWFIAVPLAITSLCAIGIPYRRVVTDVETLFIPAAAPYEHEAKIVEKYWASDENVFYPGKEVFARKYVALLATAKDGGNVLRRNHAEEFQQISDYITNNLTVTHGQEKMSYSDLCYMWLGECYRSDHTQLISSLFARSAGSLNITFPIAHFLLTPGGLFLGTTLGGVVVNHSNQVLQSAKCWMEMFHVKSMGNVSVISYQWRKEFERIMSGIQLDYLNLHYFHSESLNEETKKSADRTAPKFVAAFLIVLGFSTLCCLKLMRSGRLWVIDWLTSKPLISLVGLTTAVMGMTAALGLLSGLGVLYSDVNIVIPFLVICKL